MLGKFFLPPKLGEWTKNGPKLGLFEFIENFCTEENLYLVCFCTDLIFGKIFVPGILAKIFSANQIAGCFNQPDLQSKLVKHPYFLHVDTNSH